MNSIFSSDKNLETSLLNLLERYTLEDVVATLSKYTNMQAELAKILEQTQAAAKWEHQAEALHIASEMLDEVYDEELYYLVY
ncbi:hypothetical protein HC931_23000 [Candidatus Gracilibacteria bacterium]|jgi:protein subunit release factor A|nr:hypothetical protein [Candidatus Gracilibacteria bacterium]NJM88301.1 hypothetical protein [Hydrococcus sp. RU_2_2]NJP18028.1 hypothetical protein [Hydrococcus sp. CRU_1_1]NJQ98637.1 hypothetical protein [Hydrococcus sp. CSU_1_8]